MKNLTTFGAASAFLLTGSFAVAQTPQPRPDPTPQTQTDQPRDKQRDQQRTSAMAAEMVLQGCLARDDSSQRGTGSTPTPGSTASAAGAGQAFLLKDATVHEGDSSMQGTQRGATQGTYGTQGQTGAPARMDSDKDKDKDKATYRLMASGTDVNLSAHVGHQIEVRGRMAAGTMGTSGDDYKSFTVTSVRMISSTCESK